MNDILKRYSLLLFSLLVMGLGISAITRSQLGTSAISSVPYILSFIYPLSFGTFTLLTNWLYVLAEIILLGKAFPKKQYLQFIMGPFFGFFIDFGMWLLQGVQPVTYIAKLAILLMGCLILAAGILMQLKADEVVNPSEGIVKAMASRTGKPFNRVKVIYDFALVAMTIVISWLAFGDIRGVREGTIITAVLVGPFIKLLSSGLDKCQKKQTEDAGGL